MTAQKVNPDFLFSRIVNVHFGTGDCYIAVFSGAINSVLSFDQDGPPDVPSYPLEFAVATGAGVKILDQQKKVTKDITIDNYYCWTPYQIASSGGGIDSNDPPNGIPGPVGFHTLKDALNITGVGSRFNKVGSGSRGIGTHQDGAFGPIIPATPDFQFGQAFSYALSFNGRFHDPEGLLNYNVHTGNFDPPGPVKLSKDNVAGQVAQWDATAVAAAFKGGVLLEEWFQSHTSSALHDYEFQRGITSVYLFRVPNDGSFGATVSFSGALANGSLGTDTSFTPPRFIGSFGSQGFNLEAILFTTDRNGDPLPGNIKTPDDLFKIADPADTYELQGIDLSVVLSGLVSLGCQQNDDGSFSIVVGR